MPIKPIKEVYLIKDKNGREYYSKKKSIQKDETSEAVPFHEYLRINGARSEVITKFAGG